VYERRWRSTLALLGQNSAHLGQSSAQQALDRMRTLARWRAVDEYGFVLDILLQRHRDTEAAKTFLTRVLCEHDVPEVIHTEQLRSCGATIREIPSLVNVDHQQVISTARCK
jgi:hypothetical protein